MPLRQDGHVILHKLGADHCPGSKQPPTADAPLACWLPVKPKVTLHGLRHSLKTGWQKTASPRSWQSSVSATRRQAYEGLYVHVSDRMRQELTTASQARWAEALNARASISPHSPVPLLDELLKPYRVDTSASRGSLGDAPQAGRAGTPAKMISQIPPNAADRPLRRVG